MSNKNLIYIYSIWKRRHFFLFVYTLQGNLNIIDNTLEGN